MISVKEPSCVVAPLGLGHSPVKDAHTRLLDLLAGWSNFLQDEHDVPDQEGLTEAVCDLYQQAGSLNDTRPEAVRAFVVEKVLPLLG